MKKILLIGAGRSSTVLIDYLLSRSQSEEWLITVGDISEELVRSKVGDHPNSRAIRFNSSDSSQCSIEVSNADLVISLLPANMHVEVARQCVESGKSLVTASYIAPEMRALDQEARNKGVLLLNECGLDPGIDHMSAMEIFREITAQGGRLDAFYSYTGGLVAPESDDNPWGYKFSWNPRNVILAGQGTACFMEGGKQRYLPYQRLFLQSRPVSVPGAGTFDGYANRDSLMYRKLYDIENIPTLLRGTLRKQGYCRAWHVFVQLGLTDDSYSLENSSSMSYADLVAALLPERASGETLRQAVARCCGFSESEPAMQLVEWTGIFSDLPIGAEKVTPAQALQKLLEPRWLLKSDDKDLVVMQHRFHYSIGSKKMVRTSSLIVKGEDQSRTAMAKTVGLPIGIAARNILNGNIHEKGVALPLSEGICKPILAELKSHGVDFTEQVEELA
ncbi:MAG: saccharopine dehydrogenase C-terminal domain-containing protein [Bacteroidota bacterium]